MVLNIRQADKHLGNGKEKKIAHIRTNQNKEREADEDCCTSRFYQQGGNLVSFIIKDGRFRAPRL